VRKPCDQELREALMLTKKYPMPGMVTEYAESTDGLRGLPFSAGSLMAAACAQVVALPGSQRVLLIAPPADGIVRVSFFG